MKNTPHILIVDDNANLNKTMAHILEYKGYTVTSAASGAEAIECVKDLSIDMIFMDIKMPLMNGVEAYKQIKKIDADVVVIMMTAYAVEDLIQEALDEGAYSVVHKPLDIDNAITLIEKARQARQGALIMIVDDHPETCVTLRNILGQHRHKVCCVGSGEEAIGIVQEHPPDIVFIDMKLPSLNGLETYLAIKTISPATIVIMITGFHLQMQDLVDAALNKGAYTCFYKPFDMDRVISIVDEIWARKQEG